MLIYPSSKKETSIEKRKRAVKPIYDMMLCTENLPTLYFVSTNPIVNVVLYELKLNLMENFPPNDPWLNRVAPLLTVGKTIEALATGKVPRAIKAESKL